MIWLNTRSGLLFNQGTKFAGKTREGEWLSYARAMLLNGKPFGKSKTKTYKFPKGKIPPEDSA
jgi:hypothetical protein